MIHVLVSFCFSPESTGILSPRLFIFIHNKMNASCFKPKEHNYLNLPVATNFYAYTCDIAFCWYVFVLFLSLALHAKRQFTYQEPFKYFNIAVHIFRNLFWKICLLFRQIFITCLKCSRASFSLFSYSGKMRWGRGCPKYAFAAQYFQILVVSNYINRGVNGKIHILEKL